MDEAAPRSADGTGTEDTAKVPGVLRLTWGDENLIGLDERAWLAGVTASRDRAHHDREQPKGTWPDARRRLRARR
jgi:hypothetical protein